MGSKHQVPPPHAFTQQGVARLSSVLKSERAVQVNIEIMRTFAYATGSRPTPIWHANLQAAAGATPRGGRGLRVA